MSSYLAVSVLATGAALTVGLLTFSGMCAMLPAIPLAIPLAIIAMILAVVYEGEVYVQNIRSAWDKLFKPQHHQRMIAKDFLRTKIPHSNCHRPQFFEELLNVLKLLHAYEDAKNPDYESEIKALKDQIESLEEYFTDRLFSINDSANNNHCWPEDYESYDKALQLWLSGEKDWRQSEPTLASEDLSVFFRQSRFTSTPPENLRKAARDLLEAEKSAFSVLKWLSVLAGCAMGLGTTYLLIEAFTVLPIIVFLPLAMWPVLIIPLAIIAGAAYGFLTYNALTDMWHNQTLQKLVADLRSAKPTCTSVMVALGAFLLLALTIALTICTAGTWWTIVKEIPPLFGWMKIVPVFAFQLIVAVLVGSATLIFNVQNTMDTCKFFYEKTYKIVQNICSAVLAFPSKFVKLMQTENLLQHINVFRLIRVFIFEPLRYLLFIGHLLSEALGSTRLPGVPDAWSTVFGFVSNFFQDFLYFFSDESHDDSEASLLNEHYADSGHDHGDDLPTICLQTVFYPILQAEVYWDFYASKLGQNPMQDIQEARRKQGLQDPKEVLSTDITKYTVTLFNKKYPDTYTPSKLNDFPACTRLGC